MSTTDWRRVDGVSRRDSISCSLASTVLWRVCSFFGPGHTATMSFCWAVALALALILIAAGAALLVFLLLGRPDPQEEREVSPQRAGRRGVVLMTAVASVLLGLGVYAALVEKNDALLRYLLSWPVLVLVVVLLLRSAIQSLLTREGLESIKAGPGGFEAKWVDQRLAVAKHDLQTADTSIGTTGVGGDRPTAFMAEMGNLSKVSPRSAVLESFARLEQVLREVMGVHVEQARQRRPSARALTNAAFQRDLLSSDEVAAMVELIDLRNVVAHDPRIELDAKQAIDFAGLARQLALSLRLGSGQGDLTDEDPL